MTKWLILIGVMLMLCIAEWMREIFTFKITHYNIISDKLSGLKRERKVLFLTDLHNNCYGKENKRLLDAVRMQNPDLILIGGDMLVGKPELSTKVAEDFVCKLAEICPVYYANGNHEQRMKIYPEKFGTKYQVYTSSVEKSGVQFLENEHVDLMFDGYPIQIHGLEIPREGYKKFRKTFISLKQIEACIGKADLSKYQILLAHNPIYTDTYLEWGADLVLSGHLHGGIVRIPGLGGVITPQFRLFPKYSGELTVKDGKSVVVSKGLGTHTIKIRFLNPAEMIVLHMQGK
ncbi:MAG: metallophosphoesterase [Tyzzerella sp.]|nr:metallophosphoesterase [Tyzzerella sp.]